MERRTLIAVILSILVLLAYQVLVAKFYHKEPLSTEVMSAAENVEQLNDGSENTPTRQSNNAEYIVAKEVVEKKELYLPVQEMSVSNDGVSFLLSSDGGVIKRILLEEGTFSLNSKEMSLVEQENAQFAPLALWINGAEQQLNYQFSAEEKGANLLANASQDIEINKKLRFGNSKYGLELEIIFSNLSASDKKLSYIIVGGSNINQSGNMDRHFSGLQSKVSGTILWENPRKLKTNDGWLEQKGLTEWVAMRNAYYEVVLKPEKPVFAKVSRGLGKNVFACGLKVDNFVIPANSSISHNYLLYAGPTNYEHLAPHGLGDTVYFGKLDFICKIILKSLRFSYHITRNYGLAIIAITLLIGVVLFPISKNNFKSMRQMQLIQPEINKIRDAHQGNPQRLQREIMELYRKHKINPLGGCLPVFLQMPIFFALYLTLVRSVELKGAAFLWIKDLSAPDRVYSLPSKIPFLGEQINLLPILMIIAMIIQQKMSSYKRAKADPQTEQQQKIMLIMPILFGIMFYNLPSGLVLYWLVNTIVMTLVQWHIAKTMPYVETVAG